MYVIPLFQYPRRQLSVPSHGGSRVLLRRQIQDSEAVDHQTRNHPAEPPLYPRLGFVPLAAHIDGRLGVEDCWLLAWNLIEKKLLK